VKKNSLLRLEKVSKIYQMGRVPVRAVDNLSLSIYPKEFISIVGASGSGKSTLMHLMGCLDIPTAGKIFLEEKDISKFSEQKLARIRNKKIGFVFQSFNLLPRNSALDNVSLPLFYAGVKANERRQKAEKALKEVGLKERLNHFPNQLSGGEQQRVAIARALVNQPLIILADEPTGNLDSKASREIMEIFTKLHQKGHTIVVVTHEKAIARLTRRTIKIQDGKII